MKKIIWKSLFILSFLSNVAFAQGYQQPQLQHPSFGDLKIVVPLTTPNPAVQKLKLRDMSNALEMVKKWGGSVKFRVEVYAGGISVFIKPDPKTKVLIDNLRRQGVEFQVCNNTLIEKNINYHDLYGVKESDVVPGGFLEVTFLQTHEGYVLDSAN